MLALRSGDNLDTSYALRLEPRIQTLYTRQGENLDATLALMWEPRRYPVSFSKYLVSSIFKIISCIHYKVFGIIDTGYQILCNGYCILYFVMNTGYYTRYWIPDTLRWILDTRYFVIDTGYYTRYFILYPLQNIWYPVFSIISSIHYKVSGIQYL